MSEQNHSIYEFGPFRLDAQKRLLLREGEIVPLKPKAFETLLALVEGCGHVLEKDELMKRVWPGTVVEEGNLAFNISSLRKALGDDPRRHEYIVTIPGEGYKFVAGVRETFDELIVRETTSITVEEEEDFTIADGGVAVADSQNLVSLPERDKLLSLNLPSAIRHQRSFQLGAAAVFVAVAAGVFSLYWFISQSPTPDNERAAVPFREMQIARLTNSGKTTRAAISPDGK